MIHLNYRDSRPIYEQVRDGLRQLLLSGAILPGERLPSVRSLAGGLAINPNTIQRAYESLEQEGYIYSVVGKGSFAAELADVRDTRKAALWERFTSATQELLLLGVTAGELSETIKEMEGLKDG